MINTNKLLEIWKDIPNLEGLYEISNLLRVRSLDRITKTKKGSRYYKGKILKGIIDKKTKYIIYGFSKNGEVYSERLHVLLAMAFLGHVPCGFERVVDHIDENPSNNSLDNLQIITHRKNIGKSKLLLGKNNYIGVYFHKTNKKWMANVVIKGKAVHLGYFSTEKEALAKRTEFMIFKNLK